jgi:DNA-binding transcriptional MerR regulator
MESEPEKFTATDAAELAGISLSRLRTIVAAGLRLSTACKPGAWRRYTFDDCRKVALVEAVTLTGCSPQEAILLLSRAFTADIRPDREWTLEIVSRDEVKTLLKVSTVGRAVRARMTELLAGRTQSVAGRRQKKEPTSISPRAAACSKAGSVHYPSTEAVEATSQTGRNL